MRDYDELDSDYDNDAPIDQSRVEHVNALLRMSAADFEAMLESAPCA